MPVPSYAEWIMPVHPIEPVFDSSSQVLILGSFPSVRSREEGFYYAHPRNRFWPLMTLLFEESRLPETIPERKAMLLRNGIALWDVIASCEIVGSRDDSISQVEVNDLSVILSVSRIKRIFCNGNTAYRLYRRYLEKRTDLTAVCLPSTSPANAASSLETLRQSWNRILTDIDQ